MPRISLRKDCNGNCKRRILINDPTAVRRRIIPDGNPLTEQLLNLLDTSVQEGDNKKAYRRFASIHQLFESAPQENARSLYSRLSDATDPLAQFYSYRMASFARCHLCAVLRDRTKNVKSKKKISRFDPKDQGTDSSGVEPGRPIILPPETIVIHEKKTPRKKEPKIPIHFPTPSRSPLTNPFELIRRSRNTWRRELRRGNKRRASLFEKLITRAEKIIDQLDNIIGRDALDSLVFINGVLIFTAISPVITAITQPILYATSIKELEKTLRDLNNLLDLLPGEEQPLPEEERRPPGRERRSKRQQREDKGRGSVHETEVCKRVRNAFEYFAYQVTVKAYKNPDTRQVKGFPDSVGNRNSRKRLFELKAIVDCIGAHQLDGPLYLFDGKGLTESKMRNQKFVYPRLKKWGGKIISRGTQLVNKDPGDFPVGELPPTKVIIIPPGFLELIDIIAEEGE